MLLETFHGSDLRQVLEDAYAALGVDALIVRSHVERRGDRSRVEVVASDSASLTRLIRRLEPTAPSLPKDRGGRGRSGPFVLAMVGPTGGGKTTALVKLALHPRAFFGARVGLLTLDTFRVAALEHLQQYAEIGGLRLEVVYDEKEVGAALRRLDTCDVVLVDTPGRSPKMVDANAQWQGVLRAVSPDETHLVVPASMRADVLPVVLRQFRDCRLTHVLLTKVDELADDAVIADVVASLDLPLRWLGDGQAVPDDVRPAKARVLQALGLGAGRLFAGVAA